MPITCVTQALRALLSLLEHHILEPTEDLYAGHQMPSQFHPNILDQHAEAFVTTGGGCLVRGMTLRRLLANGALASFRFRQESWDLAMAPLDWTIGDAMASIGIRARMHPSFQQFSGTAWHRAIPGLAGSACNALSEVACHPYNVSWHGTAGNESTVVRELREKHAPERFWAWAAHAGIDWARPCGATADPLRALGENPAVWNQLRVPTNDRWLQAMCDAPEGTELVAPVPASMAASFAAASAAIDRKAARKMERKKLRGNVTTTMPPAVLSVERTKLRGTSNATTTMPPAIPSVDKVTSATAEKVKDAAVDHGKHEETARLSAAVAYIDASSTLASVDASALRPKHARYIDASTSLASDSAFHSKHARLASLEKLRLAASGVTINWGKQIDAPSNVSIRMSAAESRVWLTLLLKAKRYLEWGTGGTTATAAWLAGSGSAPLTNIVSVDTSMAWVDMLRNSSTHIRRTEARGQLAIHVADIGRVAAWGRPVGWRQREPSLRARQARSNFEPPGATCCYDLVLIDGRFRSACAFAALRLIHARTIVLIHDAANMGNDRRDYLAQLEPWFKVVQQIETMAVLRPFPHAISAAKAASKAYTLALEVASDEFMR